MKVDTVNMEAVGWHQSGQVWGLVRWHFAPISLLLVPVTLPSTGGVSFFVYHNILAVISQSIVGCLPVYVLNFLIKNPPLFHAPRICVTIALSWTVQNYMVRNLLKQRLVEDIYNIHLPTISILEYTLIQWTVIKFDPCPRFKFRQMFLVRWSLLFSEIKVPGSVSV